KIDKKFTLNNVKKIIKLLLESELTIAKVEEQFEENHIDTKMILLLLSNIHKQANILWRSSLMAVSAELPRDIAKSIIN
ncbi:hypothetical protein ABTI32_18760, partial [Acinetobacter baumannii]